MKIFAYSLLLLAVLALLYLLYAQGKLKQELSERSALQQRRESWYRADSLYFIGDTLELRKAWEVLATAGGAGALESRMARLEQDAMDAALMVQQRDSLAQMAQSEKALRSTVMTLERRLRESNTALEDMADSVKTLERVRLRRDSLLADYRDYLQLVEGKVSELEEEIDRKQLLKFKSRKGLDIMYLGEVKDGKAHGRGVGVWANGIVYTGQWDAGEKHGWGIYEYPDGEKYEGHFVSGKREGAGVYSWKNGNRYDGEWKADLRHGQGVITNAKGKVLQSGAWEMDKLIKNKSSAR